MYQKLIKIDIQTKILISKFTEAKNWLKSIYNKNNIKTKIVQTNFKPKTDPKIKQKTPYMGQPLSNKAHHPDEVVHCPML